MTDIPTNFSQISLIAYLSNIAKENIFDTQDSLSSKCLT